MRDRPLFAALFALLALSISGVPPLSGFWAKFLVIDAAFRTGSPWYAWLAVVALVAGLLTLYSMSTLWTQAFWRTRDRGRHATRRIPPAMLVAVALLAACTLGIGLAVEPVARLARDSALADDARRDAGEGAVSAGSPDLGRALARGRLRLRSRGLVAGGGTDRPRAAQGEPAGDRRRPGGRPDGVGCGALRLSGVAHARLDLPARRRRSPHALRAFPGRARRGGARRRDQGAVRAADPSTGRTGDPR